MTTTMIMIITTIIVTSLWSVGVFYLGLRLGLKTATKLFAGQTLYDEMGVPVDQTHTGE